MTINDVAEMTLGQLRDKPAQTQELYEFTIDLVRKINVRLTRDLAQARTELVQARRELKDMQGANRALAQELTDVKNNRDYWYETCLATEVERDELRQDAQDQSDEVQEPWLSPVEAEGLRWQLRHTESERDYWLNKHDELKLEYGSDDIAHPMKQTEELRRQLARMEAGRDYWRKRCKNNTATLDAAEAALAAERQLRLEAEGQISGISKAICVERKQRRETERCAKAAQVLARNRSIRLETAETRISRLAQRAERAKAERDDIDANLRRMIELNEWSRNELDCVNERAERAEARAQLVTVDLAETLEALAIAGDLTDHPAVADHARALAARIREALALEATE